MVGLRDNVVHILLSGLVTRNSISNWVIDNLPSAYLTNALIYSASIVTPAYIIIEGITIHAISYFNILVIADRIIYAVPCHSYGK